ncbi:amidohydrolase family protein [Cellulosimicrobium sp. Marseille-Q4280]|uniref:amidohydrolase family protein n=1 Tax=Cellulosimicrobium sp. Marseille-Q4280 TaxID=2937992 RepID=UPI00203DDF85|nr:amidohydrolase family protein [Cellulosimicrobium sp. Marseille-Q4280]
MTSTPAPALTVVDALVLPGADGGPEWYFGWLQVGTDGRITGTGPGEPPPGWETAPVLDAQGAIVAPGFVSAHSHLFTSGLRGIAPDATLYPWVRSMMELFRHTDAEDMYWATLHGSMDFLANGVTSAYNFMQSGVTWLYDPATARNVLGRVHPDEYTTRQMDGTVDAGLRAVHAIRLDDEAGPEDQVLTRFARMVDAARAPERAGRDQRLGVSVMGAVQWASEPRTAELEVHVMREHGLTDQAHFVETAEGLDVQRAKFAWYEQAGALGPDLLLGHFVHPTDEMVERVAAAGSPVVWQPTSNGRLGSGHADVVRYRRAGIQVGVGLDDQSCTDISDPWANMRQGLYAQRALHQDAGVMSARDVLRLHTLGSAEVLGVADRVGSLEVGKHADFVLVDHRSPSTGPVWDVVATYVLACGLRNLRATYVGGRCVARDGRATAPLAGRADAELAERIERAAHADGRRLAVSAEELVSSGARRRGH